MPGSDPESPTSLPTDVGDDDVSSPEPDAEPASLDPRKDPHLLAALVAEIAAEHGWRRAHSVIQAHWDAFSVTAPRHLLTAVKALPGEAFVELPGLVVAANYLQGAALGGNPRRFFTDGRLIAQRRQGGTGALNTLILLTAQTAAARTAGRLDEATRTAAEARQTLAALSEADRAPLQTSIPHLRFQWARSLDAADASGALAEYEEAYDLARFTRQSAIARRAAGHLAWGHADRGCLTAADTWLARAQAEPIANGRYDAVLYLASALLKYDRGDPSAASAELNRALGLPLGEQWAAALWAGALLEHSRPGAALLHLHLESEVELHPEPGEREGANGRYITAARARLARLRPRLRTDHSLPANPTDLDILLAVDQAHGRREYAVALAVAERASSRTLVPRAQAAIGLLVASAHLALGHTEPATEAFVEANTLIGQERLLSLYSFAPPATLTALSDLSGQPLHDPRRRMHAATGLPELTAREREIVDLLTTGLPLPQVAAELFISTNTLKGALRTLYRKLDVNSRAAAVAAARAMHATE